jgi:hypothetical protein
MSEDDEFRPDSRGLMPDQAAQMMELLNRWVQGGSMGGSRRGSTGGQELAPVRLFTAA